MNQARKTHQHDLENTTSRSIFIIDDDIRILLGTKILLERGGYKVEVCSDSLAGLKIAKDIQPDLIICDIMMPHLDGYKFHQALLADPATKNIPFLYLTARVAQADKLKGLGSGAEDYLTKPFDPQELLARGDIILRRQNRIDQKVAHELIRIQNEISQNISHEMRTPMTQIMISLETLLREKYDNPEDINWFLETALSQSQRLNALIDDLLFLAHYDTAPLLLHRQLSDLKLNFIQPIALRHKSYQEKNLQLTYIIEEDVVIHASPESFMQAIVHIADNAIKFSPPDSPIEIKLSARGVGGCVLTVTDQGPGIPAQLRETVFQRYYQISQGLTRQYNGLGVGLTISRIVARSLGGDVVILDSASGCRVQMTISPGALYNLKIPTPS